jgi:peptide methionine sulfoxide reductase msrA/msrB
MHRLTRLSFACIAVLASACNRSEKAPNKPASDPTTVRTEPRPLEEHRQPQNDPSTRPAERQTAVLAGGCFWGMEEMLRKLPGVIDTTVGYAGGRTKNPTYHEVSSGDTGYAESVQVVFDPKKLSYEKLLRYFFAIHDPTTKNRQENDVGTQYRSAIFVQDESQKTIAEQVIRTVNASGDWHEPVATQVVQGGNFYPAEAYHQDYLQRHPDGYSCHYQRKVSYY